MKKTVVWTLLCALLMLGIAPISALAETPKDYSENLVAYWDFEGGDRLSDKAPSGVFKNTLTEGSCCFGTENKDKVDETASITYADGCAVIPEALGHSLRVNVSKTGDLAGLEQMTVGLKLKVNARSAGAAVLWRTNAYALMVQSFDKEKQTYTLQYRSECNANAGFAGDPFGGKQFENGKEYYLFLTASANQDRTASVTGYYSEDGETFTKGSTLTLSLSTSVDPGKLYRSGADGTKMIFGKAQNTYVLKGSAFTFDDIWMFNTVVEEASLSTVALHRVHPNPNEDTSVPAYKGCQLSAVKNGVYQTRFLATLDSLNYAEAGFEIQVTDYKGAAGGTKTYSTKTVYRSVCGTDAVGGTVVYRAEDFGGTYLVALSVQSIPTDAPVTFRITPYHVEQASGTKVLGQAYEITVDAGRLIAQSAIAQA